MRPQNISLDAQSLDNVRKTGMAGLRAFWRTLGLSGNGLRWSRSTSRLPLYYGLMEPPEAKRIFTLARLSNAP